MDGKFLGVLFGRIQPEGLGLLNITTRTAAFFRSKTDKEGTAIGWCDSVCRHLCVLALFSCHPPLSSCRRLTYSVVGGAIFVNPLAVLIITGILFVMFMALHVFSRFCSRVSRPTANHLMTLVVSAH